MVCIHCGSKTQVVNSRRQQRLDQIWRRRQCRDCEALFTTHEVPDYSLAWAVRGKGKTLQPFSRDKLFLSLYDSCRHRSAALDEAGALTATIIRKLAVQVADGVVDSRAIVHTVLVALNRFDAVASVHYQAFHA